MIQALVQGQRRKLDCFMNSALVWLVVSGIFFLFSSRVVHIHFSMVTVSLWAAKGGAEVEE
jgi:hypothetical protein